MCLGLEVRVLTAHPWGWEFRSQHHIKVTVQTHNPSFVGVRTQENLWDWADHSQGKNQLSPGSVRHSVSANKGGWQRTPQLPLASLQSQWCWCRSWCRNWASHYTVHGHRLLRSFSHQHWPFRLPPSLGHSHLSVHCHLFMHRLLMLNVLLSWVVSFVGC